MRIDIHHIRAFLAVADTLQFRAAAERLHMTQPALSRIIKALEEAVDVQLLSRTTRNVQLTNAGQLFAEHCRLALTHIDQGISLARRAEDGSIGNLRIAYMDFAINGALPHTVRTFGKRYPQISIDLCHMPTSMQKQALLDATIDVGFMIGPFSASNVRSVLFGREKMVVLLPIAHPLAKQKSLQLNQLMREQFILGAEQSWGAFRPHFFAMCHKAGFSPAIAQEATTSDGIFGLVAANIGLSIYPACARNIQRAGLVIRPLQDKGTELDTVLCWRSDAQNPSTAIFVDEVLSKLPAAPGKTKRVPPGVEKRSERV